MHSRSMNELSTLAWLIVCMREALVQRLGMAGYYNRMHFCNTHPSFNLAVPCGPCPTQKMCVEEYI